MFWGHVQEKEDTIDELDMQMPPFWHGFCEHGLNDPIGETFIVLESTHFPW